MRSSSSHKNNQNSLLTAIGRRFLCQEFWSALRRPLWCFPLFRVQIAFTLSPRTRSTLNLSCVVVLSFTTLLVVRAQSEEKVVATVNGQSIIQRQVDEAAIGQISSLQQQIYAIRKTALDNLIIRRLLENEAQRRKLSVDELKRQIMSGPVEIATAQVEELYQQNASAFALMSPDEAKEKLRLDLEGQLRLRKYREALAQLRKTSQIEWRLEEPRLPSRNNANMNSAKGPSNARVIVTEYSDFQCLYCKQAQETIRQVLRAYQDDVRLVFKHLPLEIHPLSFQAAQAAFCGGKQGVFWQYHDALFDSDTLSPEVFRSLAKVTGADPEQFQKCLASQESRVAVLDNLSEAQQLGISSTPTFLVNGKVIRGAVSFEEFKEVIERELKNSQSGSHEQ